MSELMRVRFRVNLGARDAERCGLDFKECCQGMECEVSDRAGHWLVGRGIATEVPEAAQTITAIPNAPAIGSADAPTIKPDRRPHRESASRKSNVSQKDE